MLNYSMLPNHESSMRRYMEDGQSLGGFLTALLENDLRNAVARADDGNVRLLPEYVRWLYNYAPAGSWGSPANTKAWMAHGGLKGLYAQANPANGGAL